MLAKSIVVCAAASFACSAALAAETEITVSKDGHHVSAPYASSLEIAPPPHDAKLTTIFSNVGTKYPKGLYFCCYANTVSGPTSVLSQNWVGLQFTPVADATVTELDAGIMYSGSGANEIVLGLYTDNGGLPGTLLSQKLVRGLGSFAGCCSLAVAMLKKGVPVTANVHYWVVATTAKDGNDTNAAWAYNSSDEVDPVPMANNLGAGWQPLGGFAPAPAFAVYGK